MKDRGRETERDNEEGSRRERGEMEKRRKTTRDGERW
jgi:hypothetical protein